MNYVNFNNFQPLNETVYTREEAKTAILMVETKNAAKADKLVANLLEEGNDVKSIISLVENKLEMVSALKSAKELLERNAFLGALAKAREAKARTFEFNGKEYEVFGATDVSEEEVVEEKFKYTEDQVNMAYGFYGSLETVYKEAQVQKMFTDAVADLMKAFKISEDVALFVLNAPIGRHTADMLYSKFAATASEGILKYFGGSEAKAKNFINQIQRANEAMNPNIELKEALTSKKPNEVITVEVDMAWDDLDKEEDKAAKAAFKKYKIKVEPMSLGRGSQDIRQEGTFEVTGKKKDILAYLQSEFYEMDAETVKEYYPELLEANSNYGAPAGLSKAETKKVAETLAKAISKNDGVKCTVNTKSLEEDSFDLDVDGEEFDGGSYNLYDDGSVRNMAVNGEKYGTTTSTVEDFIKGLKKPVKEAVSEGQHAIKDLPIVDWQRKHFDGLNDMYNKYLVNYANSKGDQGSKMTPNDLNNKYKAEITSKLGLDQSAKFADIAKALIKSGLIKESVVNEALSKEQKMVETFLNKIAKEFDYSIQDAARFVKETIGKMGLDESVTESQSNDIIAALKDIRDFNRGNIDLEHLATSVVKNLGFKTTEKNIENAQDHLRASAGGSDKLPEDKAIVKELYGILESKVNEGSTINVPKLSDIDHTRIIKWMTNQFDSKSWDMKKSGKGFEITIDKLSKAEQEDLMAYLKSQDYITEANDHEVGMANSQLLDIAKNASELMKKIGETEKDLPGWIQDHISQAQNFLNQANTSYHELEEATELEEAKKYDLGFGSLGNGTTVWNRAQEVNGDYKTVAHISVGGNITYYDKTMPADVKKQIEDMAANESTTNEAMFGRKDYDKTLITYAIDPKADEIYIINVAKVFNSTFPDTRKLSDKRFHGMFGMMLEENWMKQYDKLPEIGDILPAPKKDKAFESVTEGAMSDIDILAQEAKDFKSFVKEFKKEYKNMDSGSPKELEAWLQSVYDSAKENMDESLEINEKNEVTVSLRYAVQANDIFDDMYRKLGEKESTDVFSFKSKTYAEDFIDSLIMVGIPENEIN